MKKPQVCGYADVAECTMDEAGAVAPTPAGSQLESTQSAVTQSESSSAGEPGGNNEEAGEAIKKWVGSS
jgi:hypothetical protein